MSANVFLGGAAPERWAVCERIGFAPRVQTDDRGLLHPTEQATGEGVAGPVLAGAHPGVAHQWHKHADQPNPQPAHDRWPPTARSLEICGSGLEREGYLLAIAKRVFQKHEQIGRSMTVSQLLE